jgi:FG-GAP-like repeat
MVGQFCHRVRTMQLFPALAMLAMLRLVGPPLRSADLEFQPRLIDPGASETVALADINRDGKVDIVSGEHWYAAPGWTKHTFRELGFTSNYIDAFSDLPLDVDGDGAVDIVTVTWFAKKIAWWKNPGGARGGPWTEAVVDSGFPVEFAQLVDLDNDGRARELLPQSGDPRAPLAWYEAVGGRWAKHVVSSTSYGHGIGAGDVNGDGRVDILTPKGWFEAPASPRGGGWTHHAAWDEKAHLGFLHVLDVNGDGRRDIVTTNAHDYGLIWFEQGADGAFTRRLIDDSWSQGHASTIVDLNGDGRLDLVTGKRYMAHNGKDPGEREPLGLYWYEHKAAPGGAIEWIRHLIAYGGRTGGGMQIPVVDLDGDGDLDLVVAGKSGLFVVENVTKRS